MMRERCEDTRPFELSDPRGLWNRDSGVSDGGLCDFRPFLDRFDRCGVCDDECSLRRFFRLDRFDERSGELSPELELAAGDRLRFERRFDRDFVRWDWWERDFVRRDRWERDFVRWD